MDTVVVSVSTTDNITHIAEPTNESYDSESTNISSSIPINAVPVAIPTASASKFNIEKLYKLLIVGNAKCGKSSIIGKFVDPENTFDGKYKTTIGADFIRKDILIEQDDEKSLGVRLQLWDIAGQDRFQKFTRPFFAKARGVVIVCDVSRDGTIEAIKNWKHEIDNWSDKVSENNKLPIVLFANKADLLKDPQESLKLGAQMERICRDLEILGWWVTSAKTGENLSEGFNTLVRSIIEIDQQIQPVNSELSISMQQSGFRLRPQFSPKKNIYIDDDEDYDIDRYHAANNRLLSDECC